MISFALLVCLLFQIPSQVNAQGGASNQRLKIDWKLDATVDGVEFYHAIVQCNSQKVVFLKFNNTKASTAKISWKETFVQSNAPQKQGPFKLKQLTLSPGETAQANCEAGNKRELLTHPEQATPVYDSDITDFKFQNVKVIR